MALLNTIKKRGLGQNFEEGLWGHFKTTALFSTPYGNPSLKQRKKKKREKTV